MRGAAMNFRKLRVGETIRAGDLAYHSTARKHIKVNRNGDYSQGWGSAFIGVQVIGGYNICRPIKAESRKTGKCSKGRSTLNKRVMPLVSKAGKRKTA